MYIFVNFANPLPSAHGRSILTRSACPLRLRRWIIRLRSLNYNLNVKKKKNKSNIILKKNHNYREYLNFFLARRRILFFCYKKKLYFVARVLFFFFPRFYPQINSYFARLHSIVDKNGEDFHAIDNRFNVVKIIFGWTIKNVIWFVARYLGYQNYNRDRRVS